MPIYEYQCSHCRYYLEIIQKISDARLRKCPSCSRNTLQKLVSAPVFRLKGSGWYETDFKSDQEKKRNLAGADKEPAGADAADKPAKAEKADSAAKPAAGEAKPATAAPAAGRPAARKGKAPARGGTARAARKAARPAGKTGRRSKR